MKKYNRHWIYFWPTAFFALGTIAELISLNFEDCLIYFVLTVVAFSLNYLMYKSAYLTIDNNLVEGKVGILKKEELSCKLDKITFVKVKQGILGRILNYGTVLIDTASGKFILKMISNPNKIKKELLK